MTPDELADKLDRAWRSGVIPSGAIGIAVPQAARLIREQAAQLAAIRAEVDELLNEHQPDWASDEMKRRGKEPIGCRMCFPHDGSWPCITRMATEALVCILDGEDDPKPLLTGRWPAKPGEATVALHDEDDPT